MIDNLVVLVSNFFNCIQYHVHRGAVINMCLSHEESFLFSIGSEGSVYMFEVETMIEGKIIEKKEFEKLESFEDMVYCLRSTLEEADATYAELRDKMDQLKMECDGQINRITEDMHTQLETQRQQHAVEMEDMKRKVETLKQQLNENDALSKERTNRMENAHLKAAEEVETLFQQSLELQKEKFKQMEKRKDEEIVNLHDRMHQMEKDHAEKLEQLREEYETDKHRQVKQFHLLANDVELLRKSHDVTIETLDTEQEKMLQTMKDDFQKQIDRERYNVHEANGRASRYKSQQEELEKEKIEFQRKIRQLEMDIAKFKRKSEEDQSLIATLTMEAESKEHTINNQERRVIELKNQRDELEKLRYVLTFKVCNGLVFYMRSGCII